MVENAVREVNRIAIKQAAEVVANVANEDLDRDTPCRGWTVRDVLAHLTDLNTWFTTDQTGDDEIEAMSEDPDIRTTHGKSVISLTRSFDHLAQTNLRVAVPEAGLVEPAPADLAMNIHTHETLAHSWDIAVAVGMPFAPEARVVAVAAQIVTGIPEGAWLGDDAAFGPALSISENADPFTRYLAVIGRDVAWTHGGK